MKYLFTASLAICCLGLSAQDIYKLDHIIEVRIKFLEENWDGQLDSLKQEGDELRLVADVEVDGKKYPGSGVRYKGNSSYFSVRNLGSSKLPFNIKVNHTDKDLRLPGGVTTLKLSNVFRDPSFVREVLAYEIAGKYMPAPKANFAKVYADGKYLGLYNCSESIDEFFLQNYFNENTGPFIKCDPYWDEEQDPDCPISDKASLMYLGEDSLCYKSLYELKEKGHWAKLIELTRILTEHRDSLESILDVDMALWMLAFDNVLVNLDSYIGRLCHNYYLYQDTFGRFHPLVWDMNLCFGGFRYTGLGPALSDAQMTELSPFTHFKEKNEKRPLIMALLNVPLFRKVYIAHMKTILEENFTNGNYLERISAIVKMIEPLVEQDTNRLYDMESFHKNIHETVKADNAPIVGVVKLMSKRADFLKKHPLFQKDTPKISEVIHRKNAEGVNISAKVDGADKVYLCYRVGKYGPFTRSEMANNSGQNSDQIWAFDLEPADGIQYYIIAEGDKTAALSPARAAYEFYEVDKK
ncbi:MAG TPA: CotH kinase family protein [Flavilitoribacter sp.]|nr:CotH kinase family protein [Flavilitoribacter sp.]